MSRRGGPSRLLPRIILDQQERRTPNYVRVNSFTASSFLTLFICRCKKHKGDSLLGGTFGIARQVCILCSFCYSSFCLNLSLFARLASAIYEEKPLPLGSIGNWLVHLPEESDFFPPLRINRGQVLSCFLHLSLCVTFHLIVSFFQRCHHHTVVVIDRKPKDDVLDEYIHDLRRAQGQINKPNFKKAQQKGSKARDKVLIERENRYIGLAVEGKPC